MRVQFFAVPGTSRSLGGFTLMEVLFVVAITTILMYSMSIVFQKAAEIVGVTEAEIETRQKARSIFSRLEMDLRCAFIDSHGRYFTWDGSRLKFVTSAKYNPEGLTGRIDITQVVYEATSPSGGAQVKLDKKYPVAEEEPLLVRYVLTYLSAEDVANYNETYGGDQPELTAYTMVNLTDENAASDTKQYQDIVAGNVKGFSVECMPHSGVFYENLELAHIDKGWMSSWRSSISKKLPNALRIRVSVSDHKDLVERCFESIIYPKFTRGSI